MKFLSFMIKKFTCNIKYRCHYDLQVLFENCFDVVNI
jgi:hypothetical protein